MGLNQSEHIGAVVDMLFNNKAGAKALIEVLKETERQHRRQYETTARAQALTATATGKPAYYLGGADLAADLTTLLTKLSQGDRV